ncbi:MAG: two-component regulator propeller domain-containing protein, partial [Anaerolineae bacterium]
MSNEQSKDNKTQAASHLLPKLKQAWILGSLVAIVSLLILGELAFQRTKHRGWTTYPYTAVGSIVVAPDGALWLADYPGVRRFDGETWTTYTTAGGLGGNDVRSIAVAPDGVVWFGTGGGVSR